VTHYLQRRLKVLDISARDPKNSKTVVAISKYAKILRRFLAKPKKGPPLTYFKIQMEMGEASKTSRIKTLNYKTPKSNHER